MYDPRPTIIFESYPFWSADFAIPHVDSKAQAAGYDIATRQYEIHFDSDGVLWVDFVYDDHA